MSDRKPVALVVHGHFYQPPRDNPWTDDVPREPSAAPFHDWNDRIHAECYRPNAYARIYGSDDRIHAMVNNYARISFNFGPTLARWIERRDRRTFARLRAGDQEQIRRSGHGGALAQVWGHAIAPLLSPADRQTQILWGLQDFRRRFGRDADGMWLPETAVDPPTLQALVDADIRYTIVAPEQIVQVRAPGQAWTAVDRDSLDTGRLYRWISGDGSGRFITLGVFNGPLSRDLAFANATRDAAMLLGRVRSAAESSSVAGMRLVLAASDGELYGHHKKFADLTLAYATSVEAPAHGIHVTNLGAFMEENPPSWEADLAQGPHGEGTAWSCPHGLGRWRRHCGCAMNHAAGLSQEWRTPLREAMDLLRDRAAAFFEDAGGDLLPDPWAARDGYGDVIDGTVIERRKYLRAQGRGPLRNGNEASLRRALRLFEMQRSALLMYASCGWFFDDVAGLETAIVLRQAAHVIDLWRELGGRAPLKQFLDVLAEARSNDPKLGTGADVFRRATRDRVTPAIAVARVAFARLVATPSNTGGFTEREAASGFIIEMPPAARATGADATLRGTATARHCRSGESVRVTFAASYDGVARLECRVGTTRVRLQDLDAASANEIRLAAIQRMAEKPPTIVSCRLALALASEMARTDGPEAALLETTFLRMLIGLLEAHVGPKLDGRVLPLVDELLDQAGLPARSSDGHRAEELVWEALVFFRKSKKTPPKILRTIADKLRLAPDAGPRVAATT